MMASWDDHETTNNAWEGGAENHQPVCPANRTSPIEDINRAGCDQNEGDWGLRVNAAFQAYMEWLPIRYQEGTMGLINGSFTQVIEWGKLATLITFDTRISYRAQANTEGSAINAMVPFAFAFPNVTKYEIPGSPENVALKQAAEQTKVFLSDPSHVMIGDYINDLETYLGKSADSGKPWQIWAANTMFGNWRIANPYLVAEYVESPEGKEAVRQYLNTFLQTQAGLTGRILYAMAIEGVEVNPDEFSGVPAERRAVAQLARSRFNNLVVLGGKKIPGWRKTKGYSF
jgi:phosphodiesterase/alkaline phosphatase D-like protein